MGSAQRQSLILSVPKWSFTIGQSCEKREQDEGTVQKRSIILKSLCSERETGRSATPASELAAGRPLAKELPLLETQLLKIHQSQIHITHDLKSRTTKSALSFYKMITSNTCIMEVHSRIETGQFSCEQKMTNWHLPLHQEQCQLLPGLRYLASCGSKNNFLGSVRFSKTTRPLRKSLGFYHRDMSLHSEK